MTAPFGRRAVTVTAREQLGPYVVLAFDDEGGPPAAPGQFAMLSTAEGWGGGEDERPFLPRAFSYLDAGPPARVLFEDVGPGTRRLAQLDAGDALHVVGPLGHGFRAPQDGRRPVLVGGGIGVPPLALWATRLEEPTALLGFRTGVHAAAAALVPGAQVATDDGSAGHHGLVTDLLHEHLDDHVVVYACGPPAMLESVRRMCVERDVPAQLALESGMACGFGACFGCVTPLRDGGYARVCVDGPVMDADTLLEVAHLSPSKAQQGAEAASGDSRWA